MPNLPPGAYNVRFRADTLDLQAYLAKWYNDKVIEANADPVTVNSGATTENINASLTRGGQIAGTITGPDSEPLNGIGVQVWTTDDNFVASAFTGNDGTYLTPGLPAGSYKVQFAGNRTYVGQVYNNRTDLEEGDPVTVTLGTITPAINAQMVIGGTIRGQVLGNGCPLRGVDVLIWTIADPAPRLSDTSAKLVDIASTSSRGYYASFALPAGNYHKVFFEPFGSSSGYLAEYYNGKPDQASADSVSVTAPDTTTNIDASLQMAGQITGKVTDASNGAGLPSVQVRAFNSAGEQVGSMAMTDITGVYTMTGLPTGTYAVFFQPVGVSSNYFAEYYDSCGIYPTR